MPGVDGKNSNATPAYGYTFNPFTLTGVRVNYAPSDQVSLVAAVVLGADNFQDTNRSVSLGGQVNWHPNDQFSLIFNVLDGPEQAYNNRNRRRYYDPVSYTHLDVYKRQGPRQGSCGRRLGSWR